MQTRFPRLREFPFPASFSPRERNPEYRDSSSPNRHSGFLPPYAFGFPINIKMFKNVFVFFFDLSTVGNEYLVSLFLPKDGRTDTAFACAQDDQSGPIHFIILLHPSFTYFVFYPNLSNLQFFKPSYRFIKT